MIQMNVETRQLRAFAAVARTGSFSGAAEQMCLSQPALSLLIKQMEENLDLRLFHRTTRKVELTPAGREFLATAERVLGELEEGIRHLRDYAELRRGRVAVGALPSVASTLLAEVVPAFRAGHPGIRVVVRDALADAVVTAVRTGEVDFALGLPMQAEEDLAAMPLLRDELVAVCLPDALPAEAATVTWAELARHPLVATAQGTSIRRLMDQAFAGLGLTPEIAYEVSFMTTAVALVEHGAGIAVLPSTALPSILAPSVTRRPIVSPTVQRQIYLLEPRSRQRSPAAQALVDFTLAYAAGWREPGRGGTSESSSATGEPGQDASPGRTPAQAAGAPASAREISSTRNPGRSG